MNSLAVTIEVGDSNQIKVRTNVSVKPQIVAALLLDVVKIMLFNGVSDDEVSQIVVAQPGDLRRVANGHEIAKSK